jgi:hypothetical protein
MTSPVTARRGNGTHHGGKKLERLRSFFKFCADRGWCSFNPAVGVKKPKAKFVQRMPFTDSEIEKILWATEIYLIKGIYGAESPARIKASFFCSSTPASEFATRLFLKLPASLKTRDS